MLLQKAKGQVLVYVIALMVPLSMGGAYVYNAYMHTNEKTRLQNTTDAVAYSIATVEARDLNFKAYTNRAVVANQIAIAQVVGLVSWTRWAANVAQNIALVTSWVPWLNAVTRAFDRIMSTVLRVVERVMPGVAFAIDRVIDVITAAQSAHHFATIAVATDTMREVARANDPDVDTGITVANAAMFARYANNHQRFTRRFSPDTVRRANRSTERYREHFARMEEMREITMESRDGFSRRRSYSWFRLNLLVWRLDIRRAGGTDLSGQNSRHRYGSWVAMDTLSAHERNFGCGRFRPRWCSWNETIPIGWGAAKNARSGENVRFNARHHRARGALGDAWRTNGRAAGLAHSWFQGAREVELRSNHYRGLRAYYDLRHDGLLEKAPGIRVVLTKPQTRFRSAERIGYNDGNMSLEQSSSMPRNRMAAMAEAVPYFARANDVTGLRRSDRAREYGNLYNPYWQAKLDSMTEAEKRATQLAAGVL